MGNFTGFSRNFEMSLNCGFENNFIFKPNFHFHDGGAYFRDTHSRTGAYDKNIFGGLVLSQPFAHKVLHTNSSLYVRRNED